MVFCKLLLNNIENEGYGVKFVGFKLVLFLLILNDLNCVIILLIFFFN